MTPLYGPSLKKLQVRNLQGGNWREQFSAAKTGNERWLQGRGAPKVKIGFMR
jgi:hypothetical protein